MPDLSYIICATPRSGSALLCEALGRTCLAGVPREYLREWSTDDPATLRQSGRFPPDAYLSRLFEECSTPNRVFGVKIMRSYFDLVIDNLRPFARQPDGPGADVLASVFPNLQYIHLSRQDKTRQAVSWSKAMQSGHWHHIVYEDQSDQNTDAGSAKAPEGPSGAAHVQAKQPVYNFDMIAGCHRQLLEQEAGWEAYFAAADLQPCRIVYEELERSYERSGREILDYLGIPHTGATATWRPLVRRQSDAVNEDWTTRFTEELAQRGSRST